MYYLHFPFSRSLFVEMRRKFFGNFAWWDDEDDEDSDDGVEEKEVENHMSKKILCGENAREISEETASQFSNYHCGKLWGLIRFSFFC